MIFVNCYGLFRSSSCSSFGVVLASGRRASARLKLDCRYTRHSGAMCQGAFLVSGAALSVPKTLPSESFWGHAQWISHTPLRLGGHGGRMARQFSLSSNIWTAAR
eukprot:6456830-Amphidinium_carterae.1